MLKRVSFCVITGFVICLPMTGIWIYANLLTSTSETNYSKEFSAHAMSFPTFKFYETSSEATAAQTINWQQLLAETSLADTLPPAQFKFSEGILQKDESLKSIFEYFLSLDGELSMELIKESLYRYALNQLAYPESLQVIEAFDQYYKYLSLMLQEHQTFGPYSSLQEKHDWIKSMRREHFGEQIAEQYFGYDESYDDYQLAKLEIIQDSLLDELEKTDALEALASNLPSELAQRENKDNQIKTALKHNQRLSQKALYSENDIYQERLENFGYESAERLTTLDNKRNAWEQRYRYYQQEADTIYLAGLADTEEQSAIEQLRATLFEEQEIIRVATLDLYRIQ